MMSNCYATVMAIGMCLGIVAASSARADNVAAGSAVAIAGAKVDFVRDVRPILSEHCYKCHGQTKSESGLRWDRRSSAFFGGDSGQKALVPGDAAASRMIKVVSGTDPELKMPPKGPRLSDAEVGTLRRWIAEGAAWPMGVDPVYRQTHWSFNKPVKAAPPAVKDAAWCRNEVDRFVLALLEQKGLHPAPEADRYTLVRRLYLDLIGVPPTPQEVQSFVHDTRPDAYEKLVDDLLARPQYGERWAQVWLDLARYADSDGYGNDQLRPNAWPYRDWVIRAYNSNMPFDRFTIDQIAGDLLPHPTDDQLLATAFHRNSMINTEGGTVNEEYRVAAVKDRITTTAEVWMGLTLGCAQCHSHKYDPIPQREYYSLFAIFNQSADNNRAAPLHAFTTPEQQKQIAEFTTKIDALKQHLKETDVAAAQRAWEQQLGTLADPWTPVVIDSAVARSGAKIMTRPDGSLAVLHAGATTDLYTLTAHVALRSPVTAVRLEALTDPALPRHGPGLAGNGNFVLSRFTLQHTPAKPSHAGAQPISFAHAEADFNQAGFEVDHAIHPEPKKNVGWAVVPQTGRNHEAVFVLDRPLNLAGETLTFGLQQNYSHHLLGRFRLSVTTASPALVGVPASIRAIAMLRPQDRTAAQKKQIGDYYRSVTPELRSLSDEIASLERQRQGIQNKVTNVAIMQELPPNKQRKSWVLIKGNYLVHGAQVQPGILEAFGAMPKGAPMNRLGVAEWLISPDNPLTARVQVNRFWARLFGTGIVSTEEDFGTQGEKPSDQPLLDWLAVDYMQHGWNTKRLLKQIVMSAAYRQSAKVTPEKLEADPADQLLSRSPRFRFEAETIRDQALSLAGLLSLKMYGPSVFPPQPGGLWKVAFNGQRTWTTSPGADKYRRGLYVFWRRSVPYPSMSTFDEPSREICTLRRIRTDTPLQAFVMLNDPVYVEAAQALGRRIMREGGTTDESRIRYGLELCTCRPPEPRQIQTLLELFQRQQAKYAKDPTAAMKLATNPLGPLPKGVNSADAAAWTVVGNVLLNLDGVLSRS